MINTQCCVSECVLAWFYILLGTYPLEYLTVWNTWLVPMRKTNKQRNKQKLKDPVKWFLLVNEDKVKVRVR